LRLGAEEDKLARLGRDRAAARIEPQPSVLTRARSDWG
jgi:hypothetical protein